jgi:hypothetical protein
MDELGNLAVHERKGDLEKISNQPAPCHGMEDR